jgi:uridine kinase
VIRQMLGEMLPGERRFIHPLKQRADVIVQGYDYDLEPVLSRIE